MSNTLTEILKQAEAFGFNKTEQDLISKRYANLCIEYRQSHEEPSDIEGRIDYANNVREYAAKKLHAGMCSRIDYLQRPTIMREEI
jgi:hypothetical protein